jgi:hypothetical protein
MPSAYLQGSDPTTYGVPTATPAQITQASAIIDGYLQRPEGLIFAFDAVGNPCYMVNMQPTFTYLATAPFNAGQNVNVTVNNSTFPISLGSSQCGLVAILDRANTNKTEACIVNAINGQVLTLTNVQFNHSVDCTLEFGMVIFEECQMPAGRPLTNVKKTPVQMVLAGQGRYGYPRRGNAFFEINEYNLLAAITKFGGPPIWEIFNQTLVGVDPTTGQLWAPAGILLAYYTEIRFSYIAGYTYSSLPSNIKQACANIISSITSIAPISGTIQTFRAGDTAITRFGATNIDNDTKMLLQPYMARFYV